ncbi:PucR family transcriptional regulator [Phaeacidiphilus oryzae]|uniref:PucR family transcriptional regulator n=1 Tax=Phaeacidiphilus oryzae TaxID=348818 RepID=UPI00055DC969|nr:PucR family transcriptional regulator [Phaeacidiphilus oryzae]
MPPLRLSVAAGEGSLRRPVRWVHTSELEDPAPFLEGGELLLTTGMKLGPDPDQLRDYVHRLADAGVAGIGFGVGLGHTEVPGPMIGAAAERGLPLLRVPQPTPFIAISKAVTAALAAEQYQAVTVSFEAQEELTRAALGKDGTAALVRTLARRLGGWAALYDASGALVSSAPGWAAKRAGRLRGEVERLRSRPAPVSAAIQGGVLADPEQGERPADRSERRNGTGNSTGNSTGNGDGAAAHEDAVVLQSIGADRRARGYLAVGTEARLTATERYVLNAAVALLTLTLERSRGLRRAEERMTTALLRLILDGQTGIAREVAGGLFGGLPAEPVRVLVAEGGEESGRAAEEGAKAPLDQLIDRAEQVAAGGGERALAAQLDEQTVLLVTDGGAVQRACADAVEELDGVVLGVSGPGLIDEAGEAAVEARRAMAVARRSGRRLVEHEDVGAGSLLPLLGEDAVRAYADALLRPLREHDASSRGDLVASLGAWLARHGQWDAAAADLGVHRHTLRYRMRRVEELLGRSLDDTDMRMELWLALRATEE